jgi:hypothetical protein
MFSLYTQAVFKPGIILFYRDHGKSIVLSAR